MLYRQTGTSAPYTNRQNLSFEWDLNGNLKKRIDGNQANLTEEFFYDALNRFDYSTLNGAQNLDLALDAIGNITSKTSATDPAENVGTYTYHATKKHAVISTSNGWSFGYDANGNMNSYKGNSIAWTSYNLPSTINGAGQSSQFWYGPNRNRWKQVATYPSGSETTIYVGGILEKVTVPTGTGYRHYVGAGSAKVVYTRWSTGTENTKYVTTDHLNSSTVVMDSAGASLVNLSFAAFGARRGGAWSGTPSAGDWTQINNSTRQGYTGHEHLDNINIIHMNGRVFDPALGRFLSADPFMPGALGSQASNRYAYVGNRPLSASDPSGYFPRMGNALKQWRDGEGQLDALELAQHRGWLSWGGVRNVSDGLEGTHVGLLSHSMDVLSRNNASAGTLVTAANVVWGSGSTGRSYINGIFEVNSARNAQQNLAGTSGTNATFSDSGLPNLGDVVVTHSRIAPSETYSWTPGRVTPNGPGLGGTGSMTIGMQPRRARASLSGRDSDTHAGTEQSYWSTVPVPLLGIAAAGAGGAAVGYVYGIDRGLHALRAASAGRSLFAMLVALHELGGLPIAFAGAGAGTAIGTVGFAFAGGYVLGTAVYNEFDLAIANSADWMFGN